MNKLIVHAAGDLCFHRPGHIGVEDWILRRADGTPPEDVHLVEVLEAIRDHVAAVFDVQIAKAKARRGDAPAGEEDEVQPSLEADALLARIRGLH